MRRTGKRESEPIEVEHTVAPGMWAQRIVPAAGIAEALNEMAAEGYLDPEPMIIPLEEAADPITSASTFLVLVLMPFEEKEEDPALENTEE